MKIKYDEKTNKILDFAPKTVFTVCTRRSNCAKKIIYTGMDITRALGTFHEFKVFKGDYKYLTYHESGLDHIIYRTRGEGSRQSYQGKRVGSNHETKRLQITSLPISLWNEFKNGLAELKHRTNISLVPSNVLPAMLLHFNSLSDEDKLDFVMGYKLEVTRHILKSGGDNTQAVKEYLIKEAEEDGLL